MDHLENVRSPSLQEPRKHEKFQLRAWEDEQATAYPIKKSIHLTL